MSIKDDFNNFVQTGKEGSDNVNKDIPDRWRPRSEVDESGGFVVSTPGQGETVPGAQDALIEAGLKPEDLEVTSIRRGRW